MFDNGFACLIVAIWQLLNSQELAYRKYKWWGLSASLTLLFSGLLLQILSADDGDFDWSDTLGNLALGQSIGPFITTVLLLEPKEKETLADPYVKNYLQYIADSSADSLIVVLVPKVEYAPVTAQINERIKSYKQLSKFEEHLVASGFRKMTITKRRGVLFDLPSMLNDASPRKLALFAETFSELLANKQQDEGKLKNVRMEYVESLTLKCIDEALLRAVRAYGSDKKAELEAENTGQSGGEDGEDRSAKSLWKKLFARVRSNKSKQE